MLPFTARNRKTVLSSEADTTDMISAIQRTSFRLKCIPIKAKCFLLIVLILTVYLSVTIYFSLKNNRLTKEEFLEVQKCPACYGSSMCFSLFDDQFDLSGISKYEMLDVVNIKNVHFAYHKVHNHRIVLKKLAHIDEIRAVDEAICKDSFRDPDCDVARRFVVSKTGQDVSRNGLEPRHLKDTTFMFMCVTHKLIDRMIDR